MSKIKRPNIVLIITDQHNLDAISAYKDYFKDKAASPHHLNTPNIDRLVNGGYSFLLSHSANPVSCPARASIFTGHYSIEHGVTYNNIGIDKQIPNLAQWLNEKSDYKSFYAGKWHAGGRWNYPNVTGNRQAPGFNTIPIGEFPLGEHSDYLVSNAVKSFLQDYSDKDPFFVVAGLMNPHDICYWTKNMWGGLAVPETDELGLGDELPPLPPNHKCHLEEPQRLRNKPINSTEEYWRTYIYDYYRMVEKADSDIGRILDAVQARNDNTVVIFTADHGEGLGRHSRVSKWTPYESSVKVPLVFYAPHYFKHCVDQTSIVSGIDIFPTICEMAQVAPPDQVNGKSLLPILEGDKDEVGRDHIIIEFMQTGRVVRNERYKYVKMYKFSSVPDQPFVRKSDGKPEQFVTGCGDNYVEDPVKLLFDMKNDPWETLNLAEDQKYISVIKQMEKHLSDWEKNVIPGVHFDRN